MSGARPREFPKKVGLPAGFENSNKLVRPKQPDLRVPLRTRSRKGWQPTADLPGNTQIAQSINDVRVHSFPEKLRAICSKIGSTVELLAPATKPIVAVSLLSLERYCACLALRAHKQCPFYSQ
jgi:hypothetical protein